MKNYSGKSNVSSSDGLHRESVLPGFENIRRFRDKASNKVSVKLLPGEYYVTRSDELITTTLGSCISVCLRDPVNNVGGMNHFMLPAQAHDFSTFRNTKASFSNRYGNYAMENLINDVIKYGGMREYFEVKIFGGGRILNAMVDIGDRNIQFIRNYIDKESLKLISSDVGNIFPRKIIFDIHNGKVWVKKLGSLNNTSIVTREKQYLDQLQGDQVCGDIELFK